MRVFGCFTNKNKNKNLLHRRATIDSENKIDDKLYDENRNKNSRHVKKMK